MLPSGTSRLLKINYRLREGSSSSLLYRESRHTHHSRREEGDDQSSAELCGISLTNGNDIDALTIHQFPAGKAWTPRRLEINGLKGRRTMCVLAEDKLHYRQFAMDRLYKAEGGQNVSTTEAKRPDIAMSAS